MPDSNNPSEYILQLAQQAKKAARELAAVSGEAKAATLATKEKRGQVSYRLFIISTFFS